MPEAIRAPRAKIDLWQIADRIAKDNLSAAIRFLERMDAEIARLAQFPGLGRVRDDLGPGLRSVPVGSCLIVYRVLGGNVEVVRIVDGRRDLPPLFRPTD